MSELRQLDIARLGDLEAIRVDVTKLSWDDRRALESRLIKVDASLLNEPELMALDDRLVKLDLVNHPDFAFSLEDADPHACSRAELLDLIRLAPTERLRSRLAGIMECRALICAVSNRTFI